MPRRNNTRKNNRSKQAPTGAHSNTPSTPVSNGNVIPPEAQSPAPENIMAFDNRTFVSPFIDGDLFQQEVQVRTRRERLPMNPVQRFRTRAFKSSNEGAIAIPINASGHSIDRAHVMALRRKQFTVTTKAKRLDTNIFAKFARVLGLRRHMDNPDDFSFAPSGVMVNYINWTFKSSFSVVFISFMLIFLFMVFVFALFFTWAGERNPECIIVAGRPLNDVKGNKLMEGFGLSWTTFTTVGYGSIYIATGNDGDDDQPVNPMDCLLITLLSTAESFIGLLYAGICTAIMFGKIGRIQSHAQVAFSDAICVEYGTIEEEDNAAASSTRVNIDVSEWASSSTSRAFETMIEEEGDEDLSEDENDYVPKQKIQPPRPQAAIRVRKKILCPVIKFQLINELCNEGGGEILDARMNVMVRKEKESYPYEPIARFLRVDLEEPGHPYFNRVWHGRHKLNEKSPLVSVEGRERIRSNGGYWPEDWNNPTSVREHLRFSSLIITMTGISNISAESVQISKRYYKHDVLVGYTFAPLLFKQEGSEMLKVDMSLTNDVVEQSFSHGEALTANELELPSLRETLRSND